MREIKFRLWSRNRKSMVSWEQLLQHARNFTSFDNLISHFNNPKAGVLMQWTGLKDKNGVEIYEGDIVREDLEMTGANNPQLHEVTWDGFGFYLKNWEGEYIVSDDFEQCEVIGNIYENPELLKDRALDE